MGKFSRLGNDLYTGRRSLDFVGRRPIWYGVSIVLVALAIAAVLIKGLNFGVEFTGGTQYKATLSSSATQDDADAVREAIGEAGIEGAETPSVVTAGSDSLTIKVGELSPEATEEVADLIGDTVDVSSAISIEEIGASWGQAVAERALLGVAVFLVLVMLFIWGYFREWKMSIAALVALLHDIILTVGVYSLSGFQVTPSAVTGLLAILGFSLYDTVVVFDKVRENTQSLRRSGQTYAEATNLAVNQTLVRSINTSIVALIPIGAILWVSAVQLGASSLQDLALAQFVGTAVGVYSSVVLAPRLLVQLKSKESDVQMADRRARAAAKRNVDPYASVPAFVEDMPVPDGPALELDDDDLEERDERDGSASRAPQPSMGATGRGRVVPKPKSETRSTGASGRAQPARQPRSKRGRK
ncbi:protein translocase subunit SecF [Nocardioides sp. zg-DK7169]|uniref:protein translocase subunit SecF n=1 Tax=Nocardioides sp. zg-DK7169 TaxID=2736600 RepID=UPI0015551EDD|nr:protein translocase subunit SecF [Nocardioides sp. zg-DK7169]NPC96884.1 protein translocase subunit SecF [Nocardioides sp. zg-DK7169]